MKIAIIHSYMDNLGGAEKLVLNLAKELDADIYTTNIDEKEIKKLGFTTTNIKSIGNVPNEGILRKLKTLILFNFKKIGNYDFYIISGDWSISSSKKNKPNLWYCHSPLREIWDLRDKHIENLPILKKNVFYLSTLILRKFDKRNIKNVDFICCNSINVKKRIYAYYEKVAYVIYPPIKKYKYKKRGDFWLSVNRLVAHKRIELQIEAFKNLPDEKLLIVGSKEKTKHSQDYFRSIAVNLPKNIRIVNSLSEDELEDLYGSCKAFITTSHDEDFGMTPLEAMSAGKPVVAVNEGGYKETITKKTGVLANPNKEDLKKAIQKINTDLKKNPEKYKKECEQRAKKYSIKKFKEQIQLVIKSVQ